jgi:hypothetical protein
MVDFVAYPSRGRIALIVVGCLTLVGLGLWMNGVLGSPPPSVRYASSFILVIGWVSVVFFGLAAVLWGKRLFDRREHLRIGPDGLRSAPWSDQTIPWSDVVDVTTWTFKGQKAIVLHLRDPARFPGRGLAAMTADANRSLTGGDISISLTGTDRTFEDAILALDQFRSSKG